MRLKELLPKDKKLKIYNFKNLDVKSINTDSRNIKEGEMFFALKGYHVNGHKFINQAVNNGASCLVVDSNLAFHLSQEFSKIVIIGASDTRQALIKLAAVFYRKKIGNLKLIAVTGTNGKTTTTYLIESILKTAGFKTGLIGTIDYHLPNHVDASVNTTPGISELYRYFSLMNQEQVKYCIMEVSSHALDQDRVGGLSFLRAVFTNLSRDHLDYHKNFKNYFYAKRKLFTLILPKYGQAIINTDDPFGKILIKSIKVPVVSYGLTDKPILTAQDIKLSPQGSKFLMKFKNINLTVKTKLFGIYNVRNILAAAGTCLSLGIKPAHVIKGIMRLDNVPGRLQLVASKGKARIFIDYAHTPIALKTVLESFNLLKKQENKKRIIVVFGCGGERDKIKRPQMGRIASKLADIVILSSDNPRSENPRDIIEDIEKGIHKKNFISIVDRYKAIKKAVMLAEDDDLVLVAGKGHENLQIFKDRAEKFNDSLAIKQALAQIS
jgi:UDP-N-acetylmuramoyl-L-alanyl-D-glutamate--2,6-diaminopimelate ligase